MLLVDQCGNNSFRFAPESHFLYEVGKVVNDGFL